jgi:hypothetical protein
MLLHLEAPWDLLSGEEVEIAAVEAAAELQFFLLLLIAAMLLRHGRLEGRLCCCISRHLGICCQVRKKKLELFLDATTKNQQNERAGEGGERGRTEGGPGKVDDTLLLPSPSALTLEGQ